MKFLNVAEAVAGFCCECMGEDWTAVKECPSDGKDGRIKCFLWDLRPRKRYDNIRKEYFTGDGSRNQEYFKVRQRARKTLTPEQKEAVVARLKAGRAKHGKEKP
jgi:hypothetical protein